MFNVVELEARYCTDPTFNKTTNLLRQLIEQYGFTPQELRQACFLAQWMLEMGTVERQIRTEEEWRQLAELKAQMKELINRDYPELMKMIKGEVHDYK